MATQQEDLFHLIKSMTPSEKRYFKLFASFNSNSKDNKYIKIFDVIDSQSTYDEEEVKKKTKSKSFHTEKQHLFQSIMKSLVLYNASTSLDIQLKLQLCYVEVLKGKKLLSSAQNQLDKTKKITEKYERYWLELEANRLEKVVWIDQHFTRKTHDDLNFTVAEDRKLLAQIDVTNRYWLLAQSIAIYSNYSGLDREQKFKDLLMKLTSSKEFLEDINVLEGYHSKFYAIVAKITFFSKNHDYENTLLYYQLLLHHYDSYPHHKELNPLNYARTLSNFLELKLMMRYLTDFTSSLQQLKATLNLPSVKTSKELQYEIKIRILDKESQYYALIGNFDNAYKIALFTEHYLKTQPFPKPPYPLLMFYVGFIVAAYGNKHYKDAVKWINEVYAMDYLYKMKDTLVFIKLLSIFTHVELQNNELVESEVRSLYRYLKNNTIINQLEELILSFFKNVYVKHYEEEILFQKLTKVKTQLQQITDENLHKLEYYDFSINWLTSKIENRSFEVVVKENKKT